MGRTIATTVQQIQAEEGLLQAFRRALREEDRPAFDRLWRYARYHGVPISMANRPVPFEAILVAMLVELDKKIEQLRLKNQQP